VAPIALYPDALVAQVLGASTFPYEVVAATLWMKDNSSLNGEALAKAVDQQSWDPSVKALTQFPSVLDDLSKNLAWTSALGEASATQQADVMSAVQRMRAKALAAGNLKSGPEIKVEQPAPQTIVIQPANPQIVYVPVYSPTVVYGAPIVVPGYYYRGPSVTVISFGGGIVVGAAVYGGCCGWGWSYWGTNWHSHTVIYNRNIYVGNSYWRGGYYGGANRPPGYHPGYPGYKPGTQAIVHRRIPDMDVRRLQPSRRMRVGTLDQLDLATMAALAPELAVLPRCQPILEIVQRRSRVRGQLRQELNPAHDPAPCRVRSRAKDLRLNRRVQIRFLDRRAVARRALAGIKVWEPKVGAEEAAVARSLAPGKFP
jgi:hypothetical protein